MNNILNFINNNIFLSIWFVVLLFCFFLPQQTEQLYNDSTNERLNGVVYYIYQNPFTYFNVLILVCASLAAYSKDGKNNKLFFFLSSLYLIIYLIIFLFMGDASSETGTPPQLEFGYILNLISTILIFGILFLKVRKRALSQKKKFNNPLLLDDDAYEVKIGKGT